MLPARQEDFQQFQMANESYKDTTSRLGTRSFNALWRVGSDAERRNDISWLEDFKGLVSERNELNLDLIARLLDEDRLNGLPNFGIKSQQFVKDFVAHRRDSILQELTEE